MGLETRGGRFYYYRKERRGDRVVSIYEGRGAGAALIAQLDGMRRDEDEYEREVKRELRERDAESDAALDTLREVCETMTVAVLIADGFHTHKRQWRRTRCQRQ
jgi:hypothetical protein